MTRIDADVLVIGAGRRGVYAALAGFPARAPRVLLADRSLIGRREGTVMAQMTVAECSSAARDSDRRRHRCADTHARRTRALRCASWSDVALRARRPRVIRGDGAMGCRLGARGRRRLQVRQRRRACAGPAASTGVPRDRRGGVAHAARAADPRRRTCAGWRTGGGRAADGRRRPCVGSARAAPAHSSACHAAREGDGAGHRRAHAAL